ncbi:SGNH/GDSL hydrolase family protein [Thiotrichales bacterium 19S9-12]|nr:SGNH/GDSL hydrolase family protein [Thiotrichales bacterium 19S9-11]MCF6811069.1 SGNH/GDSL hydrolase family protein [Thiotrichales bacterium 19S9-12]
MSVKRIIAFGDSLQDHNNLTKFLPISPKACHDGFFSNGKVAVYHLKDMLSEHFNMDIKIENFAIAGALASNYNPNPLLIDKSLRLSAQVDRFENQIARFDANDLVVLTGGGNDFFFSIYPAFPYLHLTNAYRVASELAKVLERVCRLGAKQIIISNLPDITVVPLFSYVSDGKNVIHSNQNRFYQSGVNLIKRYFSYRIARENMKLDKKVETLKNKYRQTQINLFDGYRFMKRLINKPFDFGFENAICPCILSLGGFDLKGNIQDESEIVIKENPETHLFWDLVHPTTKAHQVVASEWAKYITH